MSNPDWNELMARYQQSDSAAAAALIEQISPQLYRFFLAQDPSRSYADDLLQETWMRIHQARHTYRPGEPVLPWFYAIARHVRVDSYRKTRRVRVHEQQVEGLPEQATHSPASSSRAPDIEALLRTLPESQREVIVMLKVTGMSLEEVARATRSSVGSVKQKAHRAYESLRKSLGRLGFRNSASEASHD